VLANARLIIAGQQLTRNAFQKYRQFYKTRLFAPPIPFVGHVREFVFISDQRQRTCESLIYDYDIGSATPEAAANRARNRKAVTRRRIASPLDAQE